MSLRPMHCCFSDCLKVIPLWRRARGRWYCSESHFEEDAGRRSRDLVLSQGLESPMRCGMCRHHISLHRRILGHEFCSHECFQEFQLEADVEVTTDRKVLVSRAAVLQVIGVGAVGIALAQFLKKGSTDASVSSDWNASFQTKVDSWKLPDLNRWTSRSATSPSWYLENGVIQVLDTMLLGVQEATAGKLSYRFSLGDRGSAKFLLASDQSSARCMYVEIVSNPTALSLTPFSQSVKGVVKKLGNACIMDRGNKSLHDLSIAFDVSQINILLNGETRGWSKLKIERGLVGLTSHKRDDFRVYRANVALTS